MKKQNKAKQERSHRRNKKRSIKSRNRAKEFAKIKLKKQAEIVKEKRAEKETHLLKREIEKLQNKASQIRNKE
tara:strand:- start:223 stop:441 length:219 start_codon:yes stop_codon:yes gene_type:complete